MHTLVDHESERQDFVMQGLMLECVAETTVDTFCRDLESTAAMLTLGRGSATQAVAGVQHPK